MDAPETTEELYPRPVGQAALDHVRAAKTIADRYFRVCAATPGTDFADWRSHDPMLAYPSAHLWLTRFGLMLWCDVDLPHLILTPWGQWPFVGRGSWGPGLSFLDNPSFMDGLELGEERRPAHNSRVRVYPVLGVGEIRLPEALVYRLTGRDDPTNNVLVPEWRQLFDLVAA